jgi:UDP-N-acetylglucosamine 1-carboxyvinyltransferase
LLQRGLSKTRRKISQDKNKISITPPKEFAAGQTLEAPDCRAAAAYLIAALGVKGETRITNYHHMERGYQDIMGKLNSLGTRITEVLA